MDTDELARWVAAGSALIAFLVALRMQVIEPLIRALRENTASTETSAKAQTANARVTAENTAVVASALPASPTTVTVNVPPQPPA